MQKLTVIECLECGWDLERKKLTWAEKMKNFLGFGFRAYCPNCDKKTLHTTKGV